VDRVDEIVEEAAQRLRALEPSAVAVVLTGSHARGAVDEYSDLDVRAITEDEPLVRYRTWFAERPGSEPLHVSLGAHSMAHWLAERQQPAWWAYGFPVLYKARYVWATPDARRKLGLDPSIAHPPGAPQLEALLEWATKVQRARSAGDAVGARFYARKVGELTPCLLVGLNEPVVVHSPREALDAALALPVAPAHYRDDIVVCLGLTASSVEEAGRAALRLTRELLVFLRERKPEVDPQPDLPRYLADGTLERRLGFLE
jgi:phosphoribosyl-AMP cyclohydrolase